MIKSNERNDETKDKEYDAVAFANLTLAFIGIIVVIAYTSVTAWLAYLTNQSVNIAHVQAALADESMRVSQRPYVETARIDPDKPLAEWIFDPNKNRTGVRLWVYNVGNTPAQRLYVNGATDLNKIAEFPHLALKAASRSGVLFKGNTAYFVAKPGEEFGFNLERRTAWTWIPGATIPSHTEVLVQVNDLTEKDIAQAFTTTQNWEVVIQGDYEYMNVFGEYCCETLALTWDEPTSRFSVSVTPVSRKAVCAKGIPNICQTEGEPLP